MSAVQISRCRTMLVGFTMLGAACGGQALENEPGAADATPEAAEAKRPDEAGAGVACGAQRCTTPSFCHVCQPTDPLSPRGCEFDAGASCATWGPRPPLRIFCDGHDDCAVNERCALVEGSLGTYVQCAAEDGFSAGRSAVCRSLADCPPSAKACEPYAADYPIQVCR